MTTITVVCDSARHARGKIAKIVEYERDDQGRWWIARRPERNRQRSRQAAKRTAAGKPANMITGDLRDMTPLSCKLCGRQLPPQWREQRVIVAALDHFAERHAARITIRELQAVVASLLSG